MLQAVCVVPPASLPVSLAQLKAALQIEHDDDDPDLTALIEAAVAHLDGRAGTLGQALVAQTWQQDLPGWPPGGVIRLPLGPARAVESILYHDAGGVVRTLPAESYGPPLTDARGPYVRLRGALPAVARRDDAVSVRWVAGFGGPEDVPANICRAIMLLVGHWYANPSAVNVGNITSELPLGFRALIGPMRVRRV